ncbi:DUF4174 domain-containing protein [Marinobacter halotolerans]|uniref:DUF4174 domain-containing protein n=1 Tax=Marinobacter halotolerans TaxID=1569211 RepID=UPI001CD93730|nr:DUF4174 domain-containing protein [Marinobacter halotolerans]
MNRLSDYRWNNRLVLVQAAPDTEGAIDTLQAAQAGIDDRDIIWFVNTESGLVSNQGALTRGVAQDVTDLLEKSDADERVLLIGKDGGIKSREPTLNLDAIFRRIDAMPMRIREMRED